MKGSTISNQMANILASAYFDQLTQGHYDFSVGHFDPACLEGSMNNPLLALRLMSMDVATGCCYEAEQTSTGYWRAAHVVRG